MKARHEQHVHADVGQGRDRKEAEGRLGIAQRGEDALGDVVEEHEGQTQRVHVQIQRGIVEDFRRRADELQQRVAAENADEHQDQAGHGAGDHARVHGGLHLAVALRAEILGHHHRAADVAAEGEGDEDQRDLIAVAHRRQRVFADELARHQTVRDVVQLLEHDAAEQRHAEPPEHALRLSHRQIPVHLYPPLCVVAFQTDLVYNRF